VKVAALVPVFEGAHYLPGLLSALAAQTRPPDETWIAETNPRPETEALVRNRGARYVAISPGDFDHGGTRSRLARQTDADVLLLLSQDALPAGSEAVERLLRPLESDAGVAAAFGRQVPPAGAHPFTRMKRAFLYTGASKVQRFEDRHGSGFRTAFFSNSFAAWRRGPLSGLGWFGERRLMCEDVSAAAALLAAGHAVAYVADALVEHGNEHPLRVELARYFDIGATHALDPRLETDFGSPHGEGLRFVRFGVRFLLEEGCASHLPAFAVWSAGKRIAYSLGRHHRALPAGLARRLSSLPAWWKPPASR
jgi:rhamnosyltransferase